MRAQVIHIARDGHEAIPPLFFHLEARMAFFHQYFLIKENRQAMCSLRCRGTNPAAVTFTPVAGRVQVSGGFAFEA